MVTPSPPAARFTPKQDLYLAFIHAYAPVLIDPEALPPLRPESICRREPIVRNVAGCGIDLRWRIFLIAVGYEDADDLRQLACGPGLQDGGRAAAGDRPAAPRSAPSSSTSPVTSAAIGRRRASAGAATSSSVARLLPRRKLPRKKEEIHARSRPSCWFRRSEKPSRRLEPRAEGKNLHPSLSRLQPWVRTIRSTTADGLAPLKEP
jgi:hypothetical protein